MTHMLKPSPSVIAGKRAEERRKHREESRGEKIKKKERNMQYKKEEMRKGRRAEEKLE